MFAPLWVAPVVQLVIAWAHMAHNDSDTESFSQAKA